MRILRVGLYPIFVVLFMLAWFELKLCHQKLIWWQNSLCRDHWCRGPVLLRNPVPMCQYFLWPCIFSVAMVGWNRRYSTVASARYVSDTLAKPDNCKQVFFTPLGNFGQDCDNWFACLELQVSLAMWLIVVLTIFHAISHAFNSTYIFSSHLTLYF